MDNLNQEIKKEENSRHNLALKIILGICFLLVFLYYLFSSPSRDKDVILHFSSNDSLSKISSKLESENVIRFPFLFKTIVRVTLLDRKIYSGDYLFKKNENLFSVTLQVLKGRHDVDKIKVTLPEGMDREDMAKLFAQKIPNFNRDLFLNDKRSKEGYLFPDTYFFYPLSTTDEILDEMSVNFKNKIDSLHEEINSSGKNLSQIITMASILEREAGGKEDIAVISGILWKRIKLDMLLQVDAAPDTYKEIGMPKSPISNPGLLAIESAIHPKDSPYLFYLHDKDGVVHFAVDFSQHRSNIARYLK